MRELGVTWLRLRCYLPCRWPHAPERVGWVWGVHTEGVGRLSGVQRSLAQCGPSARQPQHAVGCGAPVPGPQQLGTNPEITCAAAPGHRHPSSGD